MALEIVNPESRYGKVRLIEPTSLGYLHLAADVQAAHRPGPVLRRSRDKMQLLGVLKWLAGQLAQLGTVNSYLLANLAANHVTAMPVLYHLA